MAYMAPRNQHINIPCLVPRGPSLSLSHSLSSVCERRPRSELPCLLLPLFYHHPPPPHSSPPEKSSPLPWYHYSSSTVGFSPSPTPSSDKLTSTARSYRARLRFPASHRARHGHLAPLSMAQLLPRSPLSVAPAPTSLSSSLRPSVHLNPRSCSLYFSLSLFLPITRCSVF